MNKQHILDKAIRAKCGVANPYVMKTSGKAYDRYLSNEDWEVFLEQMRTEYSFAFKCYDQGDGGELKEKRYPPKMACYGSSSRFIYLESRDLVSGREDFFEKQLETYVGGCANLDGYLEYPDGHLFVEAKCREIYGSEEKKISVKYLDLYKELQQAGLLKFTMIPHKENGVIDKNHMDETFYSSDGCELSHTDLKQLICHFLGISAFLMRNPEKKRKVSFAYLVFEPINNVNCVFSSEEESEQILRVRNTFVPSEFNSLDIPAIFKAVVDYQSRNEQVHNMLSTEQIRELEEGFHFKLMNQIEYRKELHLLICDTL